MVKEVRVLEAHRGAALAVAFAPGEQHLLSAGEDKRIRLWDLRSFEKVGEFSGHSSAVHSLLFDASGERLASGSADAVRIWSFPLKGSRKPTSKAPLKIQLEKELAGESRVALGPTDHHLATIASTKAAPGTAAGDPTTGARVTLWDARELMVLRHFDPVDRRHQALAFAPNGSVLFVGGAGPIYRVALPDGTSEGVQRGHQIGISHIVPSPNGAVLASSGADGTLYFWTVVGGDEVHYISMGVSGTSGFPLAFFPNGRTIAVGCGREIRLYNAPDGVLRKSLPSPADVHAVAISPDGRWLANAAADGNVRLFELS
jgi:WD40 repeat protein